MQVDPAQKAILVVRALEQTPGPKVLFASGYAAGFGSVSRLLKKPHRSRELASEIAATLGD